MAHPAEILTPDEVRALIRACSATAPTGIRNRDIDPAREKVRVLHGKSDRARTVGLDPGALAVLDRCMAERRKLGITPRRRLFCTLAGQPLQSAYVRQFLPRLAATCRDGTCGRA
jgi:site-specific recombinase XerD